MTLEEVRETVCAQRPQFREVLERCGDATCLQYYGQTFLDLCVPDDRVLDAIEAETSAILGEDIGRMARESLVETRWVDTTDHHGLLNHPYFYTSALARSHPAVRAKAGATVVLAFGNVSLSNDSFPRGFFFHDALLKERRFRFKTLKDRRMPVDALPAVTRDFFLKECERMAHVPLARTARTRLVAFLDALAGDKGVWTEPDYSRQLTRMNYVLWHTCFGDSRGELVYLEIENVVRHLLLHLHLKEPTPIHHLLFDTEWRTQYLALFLGVQGAHSESGGTHFFWYVDPIERTRRRLYIVGDTLMTAERDVSIALTPHALGEALETQLLVPSSALSLLIIHGEGTLACAGGFSQIQYLKDMMDRWCALRAYFGEARPCPNPSIFSGEHTLFELANPTHGTVVGSFMDAYLYGEGRCEDRVDSALERASMYATIDAMLPTLYWILTREHAQGLNVCAPFSLPHHGA